MKSKLKSDKNTQNIPLERKYNRVQKSTCLKCLLFKRLWMITVNMYDFMGLLDICPCGTLHSTHPYITYSIRDV